MTKLDTILAELRKQYPKNTYRISAGVQFVQKYCLTRWRTVCVHDKRSSGCKKCNGNAICVHQVLKYHCRYCNGSSLCNHGRLKSQCKPCGGSAICQHDRMRTSCKICGGGAICKHNRIRSKCVECKGVACVNINDKKIYVKSVRVMPYVSIIT